MALQLNGDGSILGVTHIDNVPGADVKITPVGNFASTDVQAMVSELSATSGSNKIGYDGGTVQDVLDAVTGPNGAASVGYTPAGTGAVPTTVESKLRESVSILNFIPLTEHAAIKARTSTYDCYPAIMAAVNSVTYGPTAYAAGPTIYFPPGLYNCGTKIELKKTVHFLGDGSGLPYDFGAAEIKFASGVPGITVNRFNTINGGVESPTTSGADATIIEGLGITSAGGTADYGVWLRARALIRNCIVSGFSGVGIKVVASAGAGGALEGNANNFRIEGVRIENCGSHGLYTQGADVNAGYIIGLDSSNNAGWGIYDSSFLGNTYIGCHVDASGLGAYKSDNANARNVFVGCYSESGQPSSSFAYPCLVLGGLHGAGTTGSTGMLWIDETISRASFTDGASTTLKPVAITGAAFSFQGSGDSSPWYWKKTGSNWEYSYANGAGVNVPMQLSHDGTRAKIAFQLGAYFGFGSDQRLMFFSSAAPISGTYQKGTVALNSNPSAGGFIGWVCVADGTPGTWKTFGAISA